MDRRNVLRSVALAVAGAGLIATSDRVSAATPSRTSKATTLRLPLIAAKDGTALYYKDWGSGRNVVFVSSWGLNSDMWQYQMTPMASQGFRCVAYDRRGHGRSTQPAHGYDYDTLADDLSTVIEQLDLHEVTLVGHSMAGGEIVRYLTRHGAGSISRIVLVAPTTPFLLKTPDNPDGAPKEVFDQVRAQISSDYPKWLAENARPFFVASTSQAMMDWVLSLMTNASLKALLDCNQSFVQTDFRADLPKITVPTLIIQGDKDASTPLDLTGAKNREAHPRCRAQSL